MAFDALNTVDLIEIMENYIERTRPPKEIRHELDINYRIDGQSIILFDIRPFWQDKSRLLHLDFAKATYNKTDKRWKIYWRPGSGKWTLYEPTPTVTHLSEFLTLVEKDEHHCFKG